MISSVESATAIVAVAQLSEMLANYKSAFSMPPVPGYAYARNPFRLTRNLSGYVVRSPCAVGGGMCAFEIIARAGHHYARLRCVAPAGIAIHMRASDMISLTGSNIKRNGIHVFAVENVRGYYPHRDNEL